MITVTGSLAFDHIMDYPGKFGDHIMPDKIHQINLSFLVNTLKKQKGGTAGNIAYNLALLQTPVSILGSAGEDFTEYGEFLKNAGVDVAQIKISEDKLTSSAFIMTDAADNQISGFYSGAMVENSDLSLQNLNSDFVVISPNDPKAMMKFSEECKKTGVKHMIDPGMQLPTLSAEDLRNMVEESTILIGNDYEISLMCDKLQVTSGKLLENIEIIITTLGEKGSIIQTKDQTIQIDAGKVTEAVDPTGAGDAYRSGFLAGFSKKLNLQICGQMGSIASCYAVEKYGTTTHKFSIQEFCERYKSNFGTELNL